MVLTKCIGWLGYMGVAGLGTWPGTCSAVPQDLVVGGAEIGSHGVHSGGRLGRDGEGQ